MILPDNIKIEKIPSPACPACNSFRVMVTDDGIECEDCYSGHPAPVELSEEIEFFINELSTKEKIDNETV